MLLLITTKHVMGLLLEIRMALSLAVEGVSKKRF
ncbi:hypothetical protein Golax_011343 [Gossypium laxum]|uniref:Uncharacterized protein n=1 Tax=Gossypium laxum TaxID=34288 RepID=A0A7J8ZLQ2_9ROSI|nr:hypothetical protein [Gossypium laxum]